jgi:acyl transferase domain-containing protein/NAD(P)H-dependent flavin oxidoreductase YrpB (nitropropane dioxygenase family)
MLDDVVIGLSPFESPDVALVASLARAGASAVLDLGRDKATAVAALALLARRSRTGFGVRVPNELEIDEAELPERAELVVVPASGGRFAWGSRRVAAQVVSIDEARAAVAAGVAALIVKGHEAGGAVGDETSFVLMQRVLDELGTDVPVYVQGGIGVHGAAACVAAGASGIVLDSQLALLEDASTPPPLRKALAGMDGSETLLVRGMRIFARGNSRKPGPDDDAATIARALGASDPATQFVALGQDAAFAKSFADRYTTVDRVVRAIRTAVTGHARRARALRPLARRAPLAAKYGVEFPIAQGPMTRVSDRAAFAQAVADAGGLPFLALSLMRGRELRALLEETRERLGDRPWGAGVLGFLPPETRDEQLALLREFKPPLALIAGGRPSQSHPLEDEGISTFLHVPSPGLLELFYKEGARKFIFEGRECGGHVGPRASLVLWESAIEALLARERLNDVEVLFAGGIHDARSAAAVAALAAPLAARGAKVGVLMGTAYLFTHEAVASGAIAPAFQDEAIACERTVLLETAPGHATRCADGAFPHLFEAERERLEGTGADPQETWAALEALNLGRLRIASKGLKREGERIVEVGEDEQRREGMYMIGQVAALRRERCSIAELHASVGDGSVAMLEARARDRVAIAAPSARFPEIAIVGMACAFPDAPDLETFWTNVVTGHDAAREVPRERWDPALYYDPEGTGEKTASKWGGFLEPMVFDPSAYGIPPRSLAAIDPVQLLSLEISRRALDDAGYGPGARPLDRERTSVVFGTEPGGDLASAYGFRGSFAQYLETMPPELDAALPKLTEDSFPGVLGNVISGRVANRLDLRGANYTVDAACASSLTALDVACKELATGTSDIALAGGADLHNGIHDYLMFSSVHALSKSGRSRPFDASADGIALGEGVAAIVLKRLEDAQADGDRIYAVLRGVGASSDGKSLGLTAPRREGQLRALERAWSVAGESPADAELIEAHGTGTVVGDRTELAALTEFFEGAGASAASCTLGSVKGQIGHTKCAAGMAGLIKVALSIHRGILPPTKNVVSPNPGYDAGTSPFVLRDVAVPWQSERRVAGVSAFGFGGTNFHAVLTSHDKTGTAADAAVAPSDAEVHGRPASGLVRWPYELFVIRGADEAAARATLGNLIALASAARPPALRELAAACARREAEAPVRYAFVAGSLGEAIAKCEAARDGRTEDGLYVGAPVAGQVAFLFPGQGSQKPRMLGELFAGFGELRDLLDLGAEFSERLFPGGAYSPEERAAQLRAVTETDVAQPLLGLADLAMARLMEKAGVRPAMAAGHSYGELAALAAAGAFDAATLFSLSKARAKSILDAAAASPAGEAGAMAAVRAGRDRVVAALGDADVALANDNAPDQIVVAGTAAAIEDAIGRLETAGIAGKRINVACAFHSPIVAGARERFDAMLAEAALATPSAFTVFGNAHAKPYLGDPKAVRAGLAEQVAMPVRFVEEIEAMYAAGARIFVEVGPGGILTDLTGRILRGREHLTVATDSPHSGYRGYLEALARLAAAGVHVAAEALFAGRAVAADLEDHARYAAPATAWLVDGGTARPLHGEPPEFAMRPISAPIALQSVTAALPAGERDGVVHTYLQAMRELVEGQRQVMLAYLDAPAYAPIALAEPGAVAYARHASSAPATGSPSVHATLATPAAGTLAVTATAAPESAVVSVELIPAAVAAPPRPRVSALDALLETVSDRTGYPAEVLDLDLDVEADLGIDSIKRIEILGLTREKLGLGEPTKAQSELLEKLASVKTLREIAALLERVTGAAEGATVEAVLAASSPDAAALAPGAPALAGPPLSPPAPIAAKEEAAIGRYVVVVEPMPDAQPALPLTGRAFAIVPDPLGVTDLLVERLTRAGASARVVKDGEPLGDVEALVYLGAFGVDEPSALRGAFTRIKEAVEHGATAVFGATAFGGRFGHYDHPNGVPETIGGMAGLLKSVSKEHPLLHVRTIDLDPGDPPETLARQLAVEFASEGPIEVGYVDGVRHTLVAVARPVDIVHESHGIDASSVVLITGGARGITARIAVAMAERYGCTLELIGRSAPGHEEDPELAAARDEIALRRLLIGRMNGAGPSGPAAVEAQVRAILAGREIRETLAAIQAAGGRVNYHAIDVRDVAAFGALIDRLKAEHGRIDGVVHGAGLIEDKLLREKTAESFERVFSTKVVGARLLAEKLAADAKFFVLFGSISGAFGNRGQTDYAAANDALDKLAHRLAHTVPGRVLAIDWGPWSGAGMVSPELARDYERRGIGLIGLEAGVAHFFEELHGSREPHVIITPASALA